MRLSSSTTAKVAAAFLTATTPMIGSFSASAQQMAANTPDYSRCDKMAYDNPLGASRCRIEVLQANTAVNETRITAANQRIQVAQTDGACAKDISELRANYPAATDIGRALVKASGRPAAEYNICSLRDGIRSGLGLK